MDIVNNPNAIDDRKGIFTTALAAITRLPPGDVQDGLNNEAIALLYNTLPHPPSTFIGPQYQWRSPDGFGNSVENPQLGRAGTPYARSVQGKHPLPSTSLPDPGLVFDTLLCARDVSVPSALGTKFTDDVTVATTSWEELLVDLCLCVDRHPLAFQDGSPRLDAQ